MQDEQRLMLDALTMSVNKSLDDITTLLQWATEANAPAEKLKHIRMAIRLLEDSARNLEALDSA
ncbi:MAG TPA: hypothetical protein VGR28_12610 [Candidatus Thermoplasmatota archaeon]|nr:hypothetical protein [Candidatus Thermoplasmatota archaeon]